MSGMLCPIITKLDYIDLAVADMYNKPFFRFNGYTKLSKELGDQEFYNLPRYAWQSLIEIYTEFPDKFLYK